MGKTSTKYDLIFAPLFQDFHGHGCKLGLENETVEQVFKTADARRQNQNVTVTLREHPFYVLYNVHSVLTDVV